MGPLVILEQGETMTAQRYLETIKKYFIPFYRQMRKKYSPEVVIQEDNASWHRAKLVQDYLNQQKVKRLHWLAQSPDLSPIENLQKQIKNIISKRRHKIKNIRIIECILEEVQLIIKPETLFILNNSMPKQLALCIKNKGGAIKY